MVNTTLVMREVTRDDVSVLRIPVTKVAEEMGFAQAANMVMLGAYVKQTGVVAMDTALHCFETVFKGKKMKSIERNKSAFLAGVDYAQRYWKMG